MSISRSDLAGNLVRLKDNGHWRFYVQALESQYNSRVEALLMSAHPDEALRGECRALMTLLKNLNINNGGLT